MARFRRMVPLAVVAALGCSHKLEGPGQPTIKEKADAEAERHPDDDVLEAIRSVGS